MGKIQAITAREILDSRGNPTVEASVMLDDGSVGIAACPSGASTGTYEAVELRDNDPKRYNGKGVLQAISNITSVIAPKLQGIDASDQKNIDSVIIALDGTNNKANLGANAMLSVSLSTARAQATSEKKPLYKYLTKFNPDFTEIYRMPVPQMNIINGGKHANWATDIQEYMIVPIGAKTAHDAIEMCAEVYYLLKGIMQKKGYATTVGDEGGYAPAVTDNKEPLQLITEAIEKAGYTPGKEISFAIDAAASEFYDNGKYTLNREGKIVTSDELAKFYMNLTAKYPIISMEDPFAEDDWEAFQKFTALVGGNTQIVGDDLYVTNVHRLQKGIDNKTTNSVLIKLNQIGTLTETIDAVLLARKNNMSIVVSHRSGETNDDFIADFAVGMQSEFVKFGAPARGERVAKYNRLLAIEQEINRQS